MNEEKNELDIHEPDDRFFKKVMERPENAKAYIRKFYPKIAALINLDTLEYEPTSFLNDKLQYFHADIIYRAEFKYSKHKLYCSFLLENKSIPDNGVVLQVGVYAMSAMYRMHKEKGRKVEPVLPFIFYNGKADWKPKSIADLFGAHPYQTALESLLPTIPFQFLNITQFPKAELLAIEERFFRSAVLSMATRFKPEELFLYVREICELSDEQDLKDVILYVVGVIERSPEEIQNRFNNIEFTTKSSVMSTLDQLIEKGRKEGKLEGKVEGKVEERIARMLEKVTSLFRLFSEFPAATDRQVAVISLVKETKIYTLRTAITVRDEMQVRTSILDIFFEGLSLNEAQEIELTSIITQHLDNV